MVKSELVSMYRLGKVVLGSLPHFCCPGFSRKMSRPEDENNWSYGEGNQESAQPHGNMISMLFQRISKEKYIIQRRNLQLDNNMMATW